jgi:hypothetical protein
MCLTTTTLVSAQEDGDVLAVTLKEQGDRALGKGDFGAALDSYDRANAVRHQAAIDFNRARALQGLMRHAEALDALECFEREASPELRARVPGLSEMMNELRAHVGELTFLGPARTARLTVNGRSLGNLKLEAPYRVDSGNVAIRVEADGFVPINRTIFLSPKAEGSVNLVWRRVELNGAITFKATVAAAVLYVDDEKRGHTPIELSLAPGRHRVKLTHPDYDPLSSEITVVAKERREVTLALQEKPPIWTKWWLWTGAAVIVAGAVVTGIVLTREKSPTEGDIEPGIVSAPLITRF